MQQGPSPRHETASPRRPAALGRRAAGQRRRPPRPIDRRTPAGRLLPTAPPVPKPDMPGRPHPRTIRPRQAQARRGRSWQWRSRQGPHDARPTVSRRPGWPASRRRVPGRAGHAGGALNDRARPLNAPGGVTTTALNDEEADAASRATRRGGELPDRRHVVSRHPRRNWRDRCHTTVPCPSRSRRTEATCKA